MSGNRFSIDVQTPSVSVEDVKAKVMPALGAVFTSWGAVQKGTGWLVRLEFEHRNQEPDAVPAGAVPVFGFHGGGI